METESDFDVLVTYRDKQKVTTSYISEICSSVVWWLEKEFGVQELSISEHFDIRRYVEEILDRNYKLASDFNKKNAKSRARVIGDHIMGAPDWEATEMFLNRYGLTMYNGPSFKVGKEESAYQEYLKNQLFFARERIFDSLYSDD